MARPVTKLDLGFLAKENYQELLSLIEAPPEEQRENSFLEGIMNRNIRDVTGHLYHWHLLFLSWYEVGMRGEKPKIPREGYTFSDTPKLNREIWEQCQKVPLAEILLLFEASHNKVFQLIQKHPDEELFIKKKYHWTGTTSLGPYLVSSTSSHYDWALKLIRESIKRNN